MKSSGKDFQKDISVCVIHWRQDALKLENEFYDFVHDLLERKYTINVNPIKLHTHVISVPTDTTKYDIVIGIIDENTPAKYIGLMKKIKNIYIISTFELDFVIYVPWEKEACREYFCGLFEGEVLCSDYVTGYQLGLTFARSGIVKYDKECVFGFDYRIVSNKKLFTKWIVDTFPITDKLTDTIASSLPSIYEYYNDLILTPQTNNVDKLNSIIDKLDKLSFIPEFNDMKKELIEVRDSLQ